MSTSSSNHTWHFGRIAFAGRLLHGLISEVPKQQRLSLALRRKNQGHPISERWTAPMQLDHPICVPMIFVKTELIVDVFESLGVPETVSPSYTLGRWPPPQLPARGQHLAMKGDQPG